MRSSYRKIIALRRSLQEKALLTVLARFPSPIEEDPLARIRREKDMLHLIDVLVPEADPGAIETAILHVRFVAGLKAAELEVFAVHGYTCDPDGRPLVEGGRSQSDIDHFWEYKAWPNEWPPKILTIEELKNACRFLLWAEELKGMTEADKKYFAVHGVWPPGTTGPTPPPAIPSVRS